MILYPSISGSPLKGEKFYGFDKVDGSNIVAEWRQGKGFNKFGRRNGLLDHSMPILLRAPLIIQEKYADVDKALKKLKIAHATLYFEFSGPNSSFGMHSKDDIQDVILIDVFDNKRNVFVTPKDFIKHFSTFGIPTLVYEGYVDRGLLQKLRKDSLPGVSFEGVVFKSKSGRMFKAKTQAWYDALKVHCAGDDELYEKLQ